MDKQKEYQKLLEKLVKMKWISINEIIDIRAIATNFEEEHDRIERDLQMRDIITNLVHLKNFRSSEFSEMIPTLEALIKPVSPKKE